MPRHPHLQGARHPDHRRLHWWVPWDRGVAPPLSVSPEGRSPWRACHPACCPASLRRPHQQRRPRHCWLLGACVHHSAAPDNVPAEVDALAPHVRDATVSVCLGANSREYTNADKLLAVSGQARLRGGGGGGGGQAGGRSLPFIR
jgi:hypothetical protein